MSKRVMAGHVKTAVRQIIEKHKSELISVEQIAHELRESHAASIEADHDDLISYGIRVAIGRVSSAPILDPEIRLLFGDQVPNEAVELRGLGGRKTLTVAITPKLWTSQPPEAEGEKAPAKKSTREFVDETIKQMIAEGMPEDMSILEFLRKKK